jgi:hypothetical protein
MWYSVKNNIKHEQKNCFAPGVKKSEDYIDVDIPMEIPTETSRRAEKAFRRIEALLKK